MPVSELVTDLELPEGQVIVLSPQRTFWEKATLIHVECNRNKLKADANRLSRHWYDLIMLAQHSSGTAAIDNRKLLEDVVRHKNVFFNMSYANYDACLCNGFRLIPDKNIIKELQKDYQHMVNSGMMYGTPPSFDEIISETHKIEQAINS